MKNHGGKRKGAGRNPLPESEKKVELRLYVKKKDIDYWGGEDETKARAMKAIEN
jgi:hypothetical protein